MAVGRNKARLPQPVPGVYPTATGEVELRADRYVTGAWEVLVNGVPSSHIALDPAQLEYEYMRWIAAIATRHIEAFLNVDRLRITHLGGGACSLARFFVDRYPRSRNTVVEIDGDLALLVRQWFALPRSPQLKIRVGDAFAVSQSFLPASRDVVIRDVFHEAVTPDSLSSPEFFAQVAQSLAPGGIYIANCGDHSDLRLAKSELQNMATVFNNIAVIADPAMLKGRRYGNIILIASDSALPLIDDSSLAKQLLGGAVPAQYKDDAWSRRFAGL